jgi:hypothetical protein
LHVEEKDLFELLETNYFTQDACQPTDTSKQLTVRRKMFRNFANRLHSRLLPPTAIFREQLQQQLLWSKNAIYARALICGTIRFIAKV